MITRRPHLPVLLEEVLTNLNLQSNYNVIDCNLGYGGHAEAILEKIGPRGKLLGIDLDQEAIAWTSANFKKNKSFKDRFCLVNDNFINLQEIHRENGSWPIQGILFDLGMSSPQVESSNRGFGYRTDGKLNMRFDNQDGKSFLTAAKILNTWSEKEISRILWEYGEESLSRPIAKKIIEIRKEKTFDTASMLVSVVGDVYKKYKRNFTFLARGKNFSTKVFMALRIAVNDELLNLKKALPQALTVLESGGRLAIITFHALEEQIVKQFVKYESIDCVCPPQLPKCICGHQKKLKIVSLGVGKKTIIPTKKEVKTNLRARSAKLRVVEKI